MLTAVISLDLTRSGEAGTSDYNDRRALRDLDAAPDGARVIVNVGDRSYDVTLSAVRLLRGHLDRLHVQVEGTTALAVDQWYQALASGDCSPAGWSA